MTTIDWTVQVFRNNALIMHSSFSTIDLSFPTRYLESVGKKYAPCTIKVRDSQGQIHEKEWH